MEGFGKRLEISKAWWRLLGILCGIGAFSIALAIGFGLMFLYDHLAWQP